MAEPAPSSGVDRSGIPDAPDPTRVRSAATTADRLARLAARAHTVGADAVLLGPGADLRYVAGHSVGSHERLTALVVPADADPQLLVPTLERPGWDGTPVVEAGVAVSTWSDGEDPYRALLALLPAGARVLSVDDGMPVGHALRLQAALPGSELALAGAVLAELRTRKEPAELAELAWIGAAVDRVQADIGRWLRAGRTEREVAADIAAALVAQGHESAAFVIVGSGPNGASPHHEASDRVIEPGDLVVVDIGGPGATGYFSDCTRTYQVDGEPTDPQAREVYEVVRAAQQAGIDAVRPGVAAQDIDRVSRRVVREAGFGDHFITRTGHGIGLEVHEHPYLVEGNGQLLQPGMAFSIEPGIYLPGRFGVRIEDIVVVGEDGPILMNNCGKQFQIVGGAGA